MTEDIKKILIIAGDFVEDYEIMVPYQVLEIHEYKVEVACPGKKSRKKKIKKKII